MMAPSSTVALIRRRRRSCKNPAALVEFVPARPTDGRHGEVPRQAIRARIELISRHGLRIQRPSSPRVSPLRQVPARALQLWLRLNLGRRERRQGHGRHRSRSLPGSFGRSAALARFDPVQRRLHVRL